MKNPISLNGNRTVCVDTRQVSCEVDGEAVILSFKDGLYYGLDPVGARIWSLIQEPRTLGQILDVLLDEYDVEPEVCRRDILSLLGDLAEHSLIEVSDEPVG